MEKRWYWMSVLRIEVPDIEESLISQFKFILISKNLWYWSSHGGKAATASAGLLIAVAGCSSVLCTYCSVTISWQVSVYPSAQAAAVPGCSLTGAGACPASGAGRTPTPAIRRRQWRPRSATKFSMVSYRILCLHSPADQHTKDACVSSRTDWYFSKQTYLFEIQFSSTKAQTAIMCSGAQSTRQKVWDTSCMKAKTSIWLPWALAKRCMLGILLA